MNQIPSVYPNLKYTFRGKYKIVTNMPSTCGVYNAGFTRPEPHGKQVLFDANLRAWRQLQGIKVVPKNTECRSNTLVSHFQQNSWVPYNFWKPPPVDLRKRSGRRKHLFVLIYRQSSLLVIALGDFQILSSETLSCGNIKCLATNMQIAPLTC